MLHDDRSLLEGSVGIEVGASIGGERVCRIRNRLFIGRPLPETVILNNGAEFAGTVLDVWAGQHGVRLHRIELGKKVQNASIDESFIGKFRDACLNEHWILTLQEAQVLLEAWRREYCSEERMHSTIEDVTPMALSNAIKTGLRQHRS